MGRGGGFVLRMSLAPYFDLRVKLIGPRALKCWVPTHFVDYICAYCASLSSGDACCDRQLTPNFVGKT